MINPVSGHKALKQKLRTMAARQQKQSDAVVKVGYEANYAVYVHENLQMKWKGLPRQKPHKGNYWDPQGRGQSKFLEQPAREYADRIGAVVREAYKKTHNMVQSLLMGGFLLQRESMKLVPVDTGNLKASAFTRKE